jgi:hypothetical protein
VEASIETIRASKQEQGLDWQMRQTKAKPRQDKTIARQDKIITSQDKTRQADRRTDRQSKTSLFLILGRTQDALILVLSLSCLCLCCCFVVLSFCLRLVCVLSLPHLCYWRASTTKQAQDHKTTTRQPKDKHTWQRQDKTTQADTGEKANDTTKQIKAEAKADQDKDN